MRSKIGLATTPEARASEGLALCRRLFEDRFVTRNGLLSIAVSNPNPQNHMGTALCDMTRRGHGETWGQGANITPNLGRLPERLDDRRLAIAAALGVELRTIFDHFHLSCHVPRASISQMNQQMHQLGAGGTGPAAADSRYATEDVPYGLHVPAVLGDLARRPAVLHRSGEDMFSTLSGRDFAAENTLLAAMALDRLGLDDLRQASRDAFLPAV